MGEPSSDHVQIDRKDIEQDKRIAEIEGRLALMQATAGTLSLTEIGKLTSLFGLLIGLATAVAAMWLQTGTEMTRSDVSLLQAEVRDLQESNNSSTDALTRIKEGAVVAAKEIIAPLEKDIGRIEADLEKVAEEQRTVRTALSETLNQEVLDQRFQAIGLQIEAVQGQFERITSQRLQPNIDRNETRIIQLEINSINELRRQRDLSPPIGEPN